MMGRNEVRELLLKSSSISGDCAKERLQIEKSQQASSPSDLDTITVGCSKLLTIMCCG